MLFWKVVLTLGVSVSHNPLMPLETALLRGKGNSPRLGFAFSCSKNKAVPGLHQLVFQPCSVSLQPVLFQKSQNQTQGGDDPPAVPARSLFMEWSHRFCFVSLDAFCVPRNEKQTGSLFLWAITSENDRITENPSVLETDSCIQHVCISSSLFMEWFQLQ